MGFLSTIPGSKADTEGADSTSLLDYDYGLHNTSRRLLPTITSCHVIFDTVMSLCKWSREEMQELCCKSYRGSMRAHMDVHNVKHSAKS